MKTIVELKLVFVASDMHASGRAGFKTVGPMGRIYLGVM